MKILVINAGSSSIKYKLFEIEKNKQKELYKGMIEKIGQKNGVKTHKEAIKKALENLIKSKKIKHLEEIEAIGHRVVHGGETYTKPTLITKKVLTELKKLSNLAPLHNPHNIEGIKASQNLIKTAKQVAIFDTAFHQTLEPKAYLYAIPYQLYKKHKIRRYGFHGTSHQYIAEQTQKLLKKKNTKIITCHLGNGSSITAIKNGKSIDTSMGFTPLEGIPMGTRSGNIDPALVEIIGQKLKITTKEVITLLNKESGLKGIYEKSSDMRDIRHAKTKRAHLAQEILSYNIAKYIGAYTAALNGLDAITFTAGIGEKAHYIRKSVCDYLTHLGVKINNKKNINNETEISTKTSKIKVFIIKTNEEKEIATQTHTLLTK